MCKSKRFVYRIYKRSLTTVATLKYSLLELGRCHVRSPGESKNSQKITEIIFIAAEENFKYALVGKSFLRYTQEQKQNILVVLLWKNKLRL